MALNSPARSKWISPIGEVVRDAAYAFNVNTWLRKWPKFDISQAGEAVKFFNEHGWVIFRRVFDVTEVWNFRRNIEQTHQASYTGDLLSNPYLGGRKFILDERILKIARGILPDTPCYFGDSSVSVDIGAMGFHKDNPDKEDQEAPDWRTPYSLIRIGVYLQDHAWHSGGLAVRDRSHLTVNKNKGCPLAIPTEIGDLVLWSLRTTHSGYATRLRVFPKVFVPIPVSKLVAPVNIAKRPWLSRVVFRPLELDQRAAFFATFGIEDEHLRRYLAYLQTRQYAVRNWQSTMYDEQVLEHAYDKGIKLISMRERVSHLDVEKLAKEHIYFPWKASTP